MSTSPGKYAYLTIADNLLGRIRSGQWKAGDRLPPISELETEFPQSRMTLYHALRHLVDGGYLTMTQGRGTFVRAVEVRPRVAILTGPHLFQQSLTPFMLQAFHHAHAILARDGMDSQLYAEDPLASSCMPPGLLGELSGDKLAALLTIDATFPYRHMTSDHWREHAVPHVHIGAVIAPYTFYVDRRAFLDQAIDLAAAQGRKRLALVEKHEHIAEDLEYFQDRCDVVGVAACPEPVSMPAAGLSFEQYGFELLRRYWDTSDQPDTLVIPDDAIAKGASQAALALNIDVPDQCMLIAMTNRGSGVFYPLPMTCIEVDVAEIVRQAADLLHQLMQGANIPPQRILIPPGSAAVDSRNASRTEHAK